MLQKNLFATLVYYDCFDYPLTAFEAWKHLLVLDASHAGAVPTLGIVDRLLHELVQAKKIELWRGMYVLPGREAIIRARIREEKISVAKLKRARRLISFLGWVPFVRMIGIAGSLAMKQSEPKSDWDFFVVLRSGRIWLGRTWLTLVLQLLGKRRHGKYIENRACLNYYLSEKGIEISQKDVFAAHEYRFLLPILDHNVFQRFELANAWIARFKPNFLPTEILPRWTLRLQPTSLSTQAILEHLFDWEWLEEWLEAWQKKKIAANPKTALPGSFIETSETALIFLPSPKGPKVFERFKLRLSDLSL